MRKKYSLPKYFKERGATLTELMIATAVFGFLTLALLAIIQFGTKSWRQVESRFQAEKGIRKVVLDINSNLRNSDIATFNTDGRTWMAFKTSHDYDPTAGSTVNNNIFENQFLFDSNGRVLWTFFSLYYLYDPKKADACEKCDKIGYDDCPHKVLIKKWLWINNSYGEGDPRRTPPTLASGSDISSTAKYLISSGSAPNTVTIPNGIMVAPDMSARPIPKILANNIMNFSVAYSIKAPDGKVVDRDKQGNGGKPNTVQYTVRAFKELESTKVATSPEVSRSKAFVDRFTMQIDQGIAPLNNFSE